MGILWKAEEMVKRQRTGDAVYEFPAAVQSQVRAFLDRTGAIYEFGVGTGSYSIVEVDLSDETDLMKKEITDGLRRYGVKKIG